LKGIYKLYRASNFNDISNNVSSIIVASSAAISFQYIIIEKVDTLGATVMTVYKFIRKKGYKGKYSTVAAFINKHKNVEIQKATVRFETIPGRQAQVDRSKSTFFSVQFNKNLKHFTNDAGFKPIACRPYRPQIKGKVEESLARLTNRLAVYNGEFQDYDALDRIVQSFMKEVNNEVSQAINKTSLNEELEYLKPLPPMDS